ncbi:MAG: hypothetical protein F6K41_08845 [Symploca sp. SIO3E6]|nr:hypothetical protein [Caldora sp. SIO3E6]
MTDQALSHRPITQPTDILNQLQSGQLLRVYGRRGNALIIVHRHHAEIAGPGAAVGSVFDLDCCRVIPVGKVSIIYPESLTKRQQAYVMRQKWIRFTQKAMETYIPLERGQRLLILLHKYFATELIDSLSDEVLAQLVGVLPRTIEMVRCVRRQEAGGRRQEAGGRRQEVEESPDEKNFTTMNENQSLVRQVRLPCPRIKKQLWNWHPAS